MRGYCMPETVQEQSGSHLYRDTIFWSCVMDKVLWLSYDLGVKGDYEGLYAWLDDHDTEECGNSVAFLHYECHADLLSELKDNLSRSVNLDKRDRIYIIWSENQKMKGQFLF